MPAYSVTGHGRRSRPANSCPAISSISGSGISSRWMPFGLSCQRRCFPRLDILSSDKTGTITQNFFSIGEIRTFPGFSEPDVIIAAALASKKGSNDPIDMAIFSRYDHLTPQSGTLTTKILDFVPFDPVSKFLKATVRDRSGRVPSLEQYPWDECPDRETLSRENSRPSIRILK